MDFLQSTYFSILQSKLWENIQSLFLLALTIGVISSLIVEAVKKSDDTIFLKSALCKNSLFIINGIINFIITFIIIVVFDGQGKWYLTALFMLLIWSFSWAITILFYDYILKYVFKLFNLLGSILDVLIAKNKKVLKDFKKEKESD